MRNRIFNQLKKEDREKILKRTLREKTQGLLQVSEEACLLSRLSTAKQFRIDVTFDVSVMKGVLDESKNAQTRRYIFPCVLREEVRGLHQREDSEERALQVQFFLVQKL